MTRRMKWLLFTAAWASAMLVSFGAHAAAPRYRVTVLPTIGFGPVAAGLNDKGEVVGSYDTNDAEQVIAIFLYKNGQMTTLRRRASATAISDEGHVAGVTFDENFNMSAFVDRNGDFVRLGALNGTDLGAVPFALNSAGQVVGTSTYTWGNSEHAFLYSEGAMTDLTPNVLFSAAFDINRAGQVAGLIGIPRASGDVEQMASVFHNGALSVLGHLGSDESARSLARAINNAGHVVGGSEGADGPYVTHAFLYRDGTMHDLGRPGEVSYATDINDAGDVIGETQERPSGKTRPFLYTKGKRYALRALISLRKGYELQQAVAINNAGQILLNGVLWRNRVPLSRVFLLTPIR
jgi:probable HAF family extracellular repeat protein